MEGQEGGGGAALPQAPPLPPPSPPAASSSSAKAAAGDVKQLMRALRLGAAAEAALAARGAAVQAERLAMAAVYAARQAATVRECRELEPAAQDADEARRQQAGTRRYKERVPAHERLQLVPFDEPRRRAAEASTYARQLVSAGGVLLPPTVLTGTHRMTRVEPVLKVRGGSAGVGGKQGPPRGALFYPRRLCEWEGCGLRAKREGGEGGGGRGAAGEQGEDIPVACRIVCSGCRARDGDGAGAGAGAADAGGEAGVEKEYWDARRAARRPERPAYFCCEQHWALAHNRLQPDGSRCPATEAL
jgi:hypothetical protein